MKSEILKNCDKMIWRNIKKIKEKDLDRIEKKMDVKFPIEDRKYLKAYNSAIAVNVIFKIFNDEFYMRGINFFDYIKNFEETNISYFNINEVREYFNKQKLIPIMIGKKEENRKKKENIENSNQYEVYEDVKICIIFYDFTLNKNKPVIRYVFYKYQNKIKMPSARHFSKFINGSIKTEIIGEKIIDLFKYFYIKNEEIEIEKISWKFEESATKEEIEKFQEKIGLKFPKKYEELLNKAREKGLEIYPEKFKDKIPENVIDTGFYMSLNDIISTYEIYIDYHKPYPKKLIPIKDCGGGDNICLDYRGKMNTTLKEPKITYYVHDEVGNRRFIHLADSYDEFLNMIELDKEEIEEREREIRESYFYGVQPLED